MVGEAADIATAQLPAIGKLEHAFDVIPSLHIQIGELKDSATPIAVMPHTKMPTADDAGELNVLNQHVVAVSSVASAKFLSALKKTGVLAIHLAIEKTGAQFLDQGDHDGIELVAHRLQGADAARMLKVGRIGWLF